MEGDYCKFQYTSSENVPLLKSSAGEIHFKLGRNEFFDNY